MAGFTGLRDMFDGGGAGRSGDKFEGGGILSDIANRVARPTGSRERTGTSYARDMFDGGGMGASGPTFQGGGAYSGILNALGIRPAGYEARGQQMLQTALANTYNTMLDGQRAAAPAATSSAPLTSPRPPSVSLPVNMPVQPASRALYGQGVPFGGYALPQPAPVSAAPVMAPPAPTGPVVDTSQPQHTALWRRLFPNGLY